MFFLHATLTHLSESLTSFTASFFFSVVFFLAGIQIPCELVLAARTHLVPKEGRGRGEKIAEVVRKKKKGGRGERTEADRPPAVQPKEKSSTILFPRQPPKSNCGWTNLEQHCKQLAVGGPDRGFFSKRRIKCRTEKKKALLAAVLSSPRDVFFLVTVTAHLLAPPGGKD